MLGKVSDSFLLILPMSLHVFSSLDDRSRAFDCGHGGLVEAKGKESTEEWRLWGKLVSEVCKWAILYCLNLLGLLII